MIDNDIVAVIIPIYQVQDYLVRCIESVLNQTYQDFLIVLVDDGSVDDCAKICDYYVNKDIRIYVVHKKNGGLSDARNYGIDFSMLYGDEIRWISFLDSDDWLNKNNLSVLLGCAVENNVKIAIGDFVRTTGDCDVSINDYPYQLLTPEGMWANERTTALVAWGKICKLDLFHTVRYPVGMINEDEFTTYKVLFSCDRIAYVQAPLYNYYQSSNSIMRSEWTPKRLDVIQAYEEQMEYFESNKYGIAYKHSLYAYYQVLIKSVRWIQVAKPKYNNYLKPTKKKLWKAMKLFSDNFGWKETLSFWYRIRIKGMLGKSLKNGGVVGVLKRCVGRIKRR